ncbi:hypothetical protein GCM10010433_74620 [Streptomyces pulveraceus]|uniref:hypothetical protein n=1 Tax=Streptomyces pulveraceus TaxID=68258 RepID=UPI0031D719C4
MVGGWWLSLVALSFTPSCASWANPVEAHFGPLRQSTTAGTDASSDHRNHTVRARATARLPAVARRSRPPPDVLAAHDAYAPTTRTRSRPP